MEENGKEVKLTHPLKMKAIASDRLKNDNIDSRILAYLLRADLPALSYVPTKPICAARELLRYHASLVRIEKGIKNKIHAILAKNNIIHIVSDLFGKQGRDLRMSFSLGEIYRMALDGYLSILDELEKQMKATNKRIVVSVRDDEEARLLMPILGVGY